MKTSYGAVCEKKSNCDNSRSFINNNCYGFYYYAPTRGEELPPIEKDIESILVLNVIDESDEEATLVEDAPPEPVHCPPVNITKMSFGIYEGYLFIKVEFLGKLPVRKDDPVIKITVCILMDTDGNDSSGWCGYDAMGSFYITWDILGFPDSEALITYNIATTADEEEAFENATRIPGDYEGGPGKNYVILWVSMDLLGLKSGQNVVMDIHAEAESEEYHHYVFDALMSSQYKYNGTGNYFWHSVVIPIP